MLVKVKINIWKDFMCCALSVIIHNKLASLEGKLRQNDYEIEKILPNENMLV